MTYTARDYILEAATGLNVAQWEDLLAREGKNPLIDECLGTVRVKTSLPPVSWRNLGEPK